MPNSADKGEMRRKWSHREKGQSFGVLRDEELSRRDSFLKTLKEVRVSHAHLDGKCLPSRQDNPKKVTGGVVLGVLLGV